MPLCPSWSNVRQSRFGVPPSQSLFADAAHHVARLSVLASMPRTVEHIVEKAAPHGVDQSLTDAPVYPKIYTAQRQTHEQHECEYSHPRPKVAIHLARGNINDALADVDEQQAEDDAQQAKCQTQEELEPETFALFIEISQLVQHRELYFSHRFHRFTQIFYLT